MIDVIKNNLIFPTLSRLGSMAAGFLVSLGMHEPSAQQVAVGLTALGLFSVDLVASWINRKRERK